MDKQIREMHEKTARTRYQFLKAELQTCFTAMDLAKHELSTGNFDVAEREVRFVEEGIRTIRRFSGEASIEQQKEIESRVADLQRSLDLIKTKLGR